ncbi:DUF4232 domain-containing protein [Allosaccharopolyspora coralli]|uniref:DUF4232 domain-containing protein n=1 Tax=Allosaccharopolyspora coralli TaxID=2665642 RepID=A0A5Q3QBF1_9PSEU|nr:DUF4232 domain-containing protein [Allosaccharopolyspora coralli]
MLLASCGRATDDLAAQVPAAPPAPQQAEQPATAPEPPPPPAPAPSTEDSEASGPAPEQSEVQQDELQQAEVQRCHTSMLSGILQPGNPGAGQRHADLVLRNDSGETCTLYGYGGLQLVDAEGRPLPTDFTRNANPGPTLIELAPGDAAAATLHWSVVPHGDEPVTEPCAPTPAGAEVIPPDETDPLPVEWPFGPVCGQGSVDGTAYH